MSPQLYPAAHLSKASNANPSNQSPFSHSPAGRFHADAMSSSALREQVMINHMVSATGCGQDQAKQLLQATQWQFEAALSLFLQGQSMPPTPTLKMTHGSGGARKLKPVLAPANTPATPPNFPETLISFSRLTASDPSGN